MERTIRSQAACAALLLTSLVASAHANESVYQQLLKSSAMIVTSHGFGSGALVDVERRLVFTCYHVVKTEKEVRVVFPQYKDGSLQTNRSDVAARLDQVSVPGRVITVDPRRDLALVEIESIPEGIVPVTLAEASTLPGTNVHSIGNPAISSAMWLYTTGTVRQVYDKRYQLEGNQQVEAKVVETQAPINSGDSGGPVVNDAGELVGIVSATSTKGTLVSICIDVTELRSLLAGENHTVDSEIKQMLDGGKYAYELQENGTFMVDVAVGEGQQRVVIDAQVFEYRSRRIRHLWAVMARFDGPISLDLARFLLADNSNRKFGNWEVAKEGSEYFVLFRADLDVHADLAQVEEMLVGIAHLVVATRTKLIEQAKKRAPAVAKVTKPLIGTWVAKVPQRGGGKIAYAVSFGRDGSIAWYVTDGQRALFQLEGTFTFDGRDLRYGNGKRKMVGSLEIVGPNTLVYRDATTVLRLTRFERSGTDTVATAPQPR